MRSVRLSLAVVFLGVAVLAGLLGFIVTRQIAAAPSRSAPLTVVPLPATPKPSPSPEPSPSPSPSADSGTGGSQGSRCQTGCECSFPPGGGIIVLCQGR